MLKNNNIPTNKKFGGTFTFLFFVLGIFLFYNKNFLFSYLILSISLTFFLLTIFFAHSLSTLNRRWMEFGYFLGKITNPIIMGILFFFIISPLAIFFKIIKRDELNLEIKDINSYFIHKNDTSSNIESFKDQF